MADVLTIDLSDTPPANRQAISLGEKGEALAAEHLVRNGYRIVVSNFKIPIGRNSRGVQVTGEIDIIALDGEILCFIEVKSRRSDEFMPLISNIDRRKQRQIIRAAKAYRRVFNIRDIKFRYDAVTVLLPSGAEPEIELTQGYWTEGKFRKKTWNHEPWQDYL